MRLAFVTINGSCWGGSEVLWTQTAMKALKEGHQVLVSTFDWDDQPVWIRNLELSGAKMVYRRRFYPSLPQRLRKKMLNFVFPKGRKYTYHQYLIDYKADKIFFNLGGGDEIAADSKDLMILIRQTTIPYYVFCHSISFNPISSDMLKANLIECYSKAKKVFFTSQMQAQLLKKQLHYSFKNFAILNHPLTHCFDHPIPYPASDVISFAMVGSLIKAWKGQDIAIKIFSGEQWKGRNWKLNIYGDGNDKRHLQQMVIQLGLQEKVIFHGYIDNHADIWKQNNVLLVPSQQDSGPITIFEAMNAGRAVIGTKMGTIPDYIESEVNGIVANGVSIEELSKALEIAWAKRSGWEQWGKNGFSILKQKYDFNADKTLLNILVND